MSTCATEGTPSTFWTQSELAPKPIHMNITRPLSTATVPHSKQQLNAVMFWWQYFIFLYLYEPGERLCKGRLQQFGTLTLYNEAVSDKPDSWSTSNLRTVMKKLNSQPLHNFQVELIL